MAPHARAAACRRRCVAPFLMVATLWAGACSGDRTPLEPVAFCGPGPNTSIPSPAAAATDVALALEDAAHRLVPALGTADPFVRTQNSLTELANHVRQNRLESACIVADELWDAVAALPVGAAGEADRDAIVLALREALALPLPRGS
jgi:hypothetical protein